MKEKIFNALNPDNDSVLSRVVNNILLALILLTLISIVLQSYQGIEFKYGIYFKWFESVTVLIFTIEYFLRVYVSNFSASKGTLNQGRLSYILSPIAIIDLLAILPFYLPILIPVDLRFLRLLRLLRLLRVFKLGRYSKALVRIWQVIEKKQNELISSIFIMVFVLITSSILMYNAENAAQPDKFSSIPTTFWWAICTLTTVGYGDVYPITAMGKIIASIITVLGIGLIALPTAIISSGFLDEIKTKNQIECPHCGKEIKLDEK